MRYSVKAGDTGPCVTKGVGVDFSTNYTVLASAEDQAAAVSYYHRRDITAFQVAPEGDPANGLAVVPIFTGQGSPGDQAAPNTTGAGDIITVTFAAGPVGTVKQFLYMSKTTDPTGDRFLVASGPDGFAAGGIAIGDPNLSPAAGVVVVGLAAGTPGADAVLIQAEPTVDQSIVNGATATIGSIATTSEIVSSPGDGTLDVGDHQFAVVNARAPESSVAGVELWFELILIDDTTGYEKTYPNSGRDVIVFEDDVTP